MRGLGRRLIAWIAPEDLRTALLDDLDEAAARETQDRSRLSGSWWRARQTAATLVEVSKLRVRRRWDVDAVPAGGRPALGAAFIRDLRYALRVLRRSPAFTLTAIGTLALGIGANAAIFSLVKAVLLEPLPYQDPSRLVMIWNPSEDKDPTWLSAPEIESYRHEAHSFASLAAWDTGDVSLTGVGEPERVRVGLVTGEMFDLLGVPALTGRGLQVADARPGATPVIVLGRGFWERRFGGDASMVGRSIQINGESRLVVGVMPASFRLPLDYRSDQPTDAWVPLVFTAGNLASWGDHSFFGVARLAPGVAPAAVAADLRGVENGWVRDGHRQDSGNDRWHRAGLPLHEFLSGNARLPLMILFVAVAGVLLIACANVVNLLLVRSDARRHEALVRSSLGAGRATLIRQALTESLVLAAAGAAVGLFVARASLQILLLLKPASLPRIGDVGIDSGVVAFTALVAAATALLCGIGPAVQFARANLATALRESGRSHTPGRARLAVGRVLVAGQLACSVMLVIAAGLLLRTLAELSQVNLGFNPHGVLTAELQLPPGTYATPDRTIAFYRNLIDRLEGAPGVQSAAAIRVLPLSRVIGNWSITVEDHPAAPNENPNGDFQWATPDYFQTIGATLVRGRFFARTDDSAAPPVAVLNEAMATRYWPTEDALGRRFRMWTLDRQWITIVGIIRNTHANQIVEAPRAEMYLLHSQLPQTTGGAARGMALVVRTDGDPLAATATLRSAVRALDPDLPISRIRTLDSVVADALSAPRFAATLLGVFAGLALVLAAIGTYGTMAMLVAARTPEIGIRLALGAGRSSIFGLIVGHGLAVAGVGIAVGIAGAAAASKVLSSLLYGVRAIDPLTFVGTSMLLLLAAAAACAIPARRAAAVDPVTTMRG